MEVKAKGDCLNPIVIDSSDSVGSGDDDGNTVTQAKQEQASKRKRWEWSSSSSGSDLDDFDDCLVKTLKTIEDSPIKRKLTPAVDLASDDDFYHGNSKLPVYSRCTTRLDTQELVTILLDPDLKQEKICKTQPVVVEHNAVFIVDLSALECVKDLNCDDMGSWQSNGVYRAWVNVDSNGFVTSYGKLKPTKSSTGVYLITKKYYVHKTSKDLKKTVVLLSDNEEDTLNLALIQYSFDGDEHTVIPRPHANSNRPESYVRTMPSTLKKLKSVAADLTPKFAVCDSQTGDLLTASSAGALPRNRQQVADMRRRRDDDKEQFFGRKKDPLFSVMLMCKESEGGKPQDSFVRMVSGAPEPMTVLAYNWSLDDIERFCTKSQCTVLSVDPTFNLGAFDVTVTTYRHLLLTNSRGKHPVLMGPIFIHQRKKFESYYFFASSLVGLKSALCDLRAFGTDGEKALASAFQTVFRRAIHLRCFLHLRGNLEARLRDYGIPKHIQIEFIRDIFGNPSQLEDGIVDANSSAEYEAMVQSLQIIWNDREKTYNNPPQFYQWFLSNCKNEIRETMLKGKRIASGLGDPPEPFYTNDVESQNNVIKHQMNYKTQELPQFISSMKTMMINQRKEIEKAVAGIGEYRLVESYKHLAIDTRKFFQMSDKQREKAVKAVFTIPLEVVKELSLQDHTPPSTSSNPDHTSSSTLSIPDKPAENKLLRLPIPTYLAEKVWDESTNVLATDGSVCPSPGCKDKSEWLVKSTDLKRKSPYFVECRKNGQVVCEPICGVYTSSKVCVHTVSVARHIGKLGQYLQWLLKQKEGTLNVSKLAAVDMPAGSGKKGSRRKASQKKSTKAIKNILDESTGSHTYRVNSATCSSDPLPFSSASQVVYSQASTDDDMVSAYNDNSLTTGEPFYPTPTLPSHPLPLHPSHTPHPPLPPPLLQDVSYSRCGQPPPLTGVTQNVTMPYSPMVYAPVMMGLSPHQHVESSGTNAFWLTFVKGNISRCTGCGQRTLRGEDGRPRLPPYNLCLQHKEYVLFENPHTGLHQLSSEPRNVYYHASQRCVMLKYKDFNPRTDVKVSSDIRSQLTATHLDYIMQEFGLAVLNA